MKLRQDQLEKQLTGQLQSIYLVSGDEPLLVMEACDLIRTAAKASGITERQVFHAESGFDWNTLREEANAMSLFSDQRVLEVRIPNGKPSDRGEALTALSQNPNPDNLILVICPRLDAATQKSRWYKAIESAGITVAVWPIERNQYPGWLSNRFRQSGLSSDHEAISYLANQTEGNLLAAVQEIEKLKISGQSHITVDQLQQSIGDNSRYDAFAFVDSCLTGNAAHALHMLSHLRAEGVAPLPILGALTMKLRQLSSLAGLRGPDLAQGLKQQRIWPKQEPIYRKAVSNLSESTVLQAFKLAEEIDSASKGSGKDPWLLLSELTLLLTNTEIAAQIG